MPPWRKIDSTLVDKTSQSHDFLESVARAFDVAALATQIEDRFYRLHGRTIRVRFAGSALIPLISSALEHLLQPIETDPSLTVCVWDDFSTGTTMPPPPWGDSYPYTRRGDVRGYSNDQIHTAYNFQAGSLSIFDRRESVAYYWTRDAGRLPDYESSAPLRTILHWWTRCCDAQLVHAAAIADERGAVLLAGKGGSGKSTIALQCLLSGLAYLSDDYCMISIDSVSTVHCLYSSAKLHAQDLNFFPELIPALANRQHLPNQKAVFFLYQDFRERIAYSMPIRAILLPSLNAECKIGIRPTSATEGFRALALSTMSQLANAGKTSIAKMHEFTRRTPVYHLSVGNERPEIPKVMHAILEQL